MEKNKRHVQVPNDMTITHTISPKDLLIYTAIKRYANKDGISYPSLKRISEDSGAAINTVRKSLAILEKEGYIEIDKSKKNNVYHCKKYDNFEPFSYEFLDKKDLSFTDKAYCIASQQYMIKDNNEGKISFTNKELSSNFIACWSKGSLNTLLISLYAAKLSALSPGFNCPILLNT